MKMVFKFEEHNFLKEFKSKVLSCEPSPVEFTVDSKTSTIDGYKVIMENTILFPEGCGQPSDTGYLNDSKVYHVARKGDIAIHYVDKSLIVGEEVLQTVDWDRRADHMQQHTGQHLISAVFEREHGIITTNWELGSKTSYIDLEGLDIEEKIKTVEKRVNALIRENRQVSVITQSSNVPVEADVRQCRFHQNSDVRIINIEGLDKTKCCGTHVTSLSQIQAINLSEMDDHYLNINSRRLHFLCGHRVLQKLQEYLNREKELTKILHTSPDNYVEMIHNINQKQSICDRDMALLLGEVAHNIAKKLKNAKPPPKYFIYHKDEADPVFIDAIINRLGTKEIFLCITTGYIDDSAYLTTYGPQEAVAILGPKLGKYLGGQGFLEQNRYTAVFKKDTPKMMESEKIIREYFESSE